ncbi:dehydrogenase [Mycolicibacter sinensis]|uniref:Dehydrogenase n=2 Tax=Mycolicibacter sinensis (strain JDM601) TaxID=875328 RepID=A0A1A2NM49_MYCSD|nr:carboxymuconolactone decarboxylase family protein [Mycolicibacter sinensis]OBH16143.1 dehydrogenase [Mycolicibacter sinensis]OBI31764.1 dehydrogenase [Mycolicibacter sinensis]
MKLAHQDQVEGLDPAFARMAIEVGRHAWSLPQLTMREKAFVFLAADLCTANLGFALATHVQMAGANGVTAVDCIAAIRHLAPYVGYPTAAVALQRLVDPGATADTPRMAESRQLPAEVVDELTALNPDFAAFVAEQFRQRWSDDPELSQRERALSCLATDVLNQTLDESFALHVELAEAAGAGPGQINAVLLLVAEYGMAKAWRAYRTLARIRVRPD